MIWLENVILQWTVRFSCLEITGLGCLNLGISRDFGESLVTLFSMRCWPYD